MVERPLSFYYVDESDPDILVLRRQDGSFVGLLAPEPPGMPSRAWPRAGWVPPRRTSSRQWSRTVALLH